MDIVGERVARVVGAIAVGAGLLLIARTADFGWDDVFMNFIHRLMQTM
jgi:hypothetical protein